MVLADPDWGQVASNTLWPHFPATQAFLFLAVAIIGTTITPYMQLYQAAAVADRGIGPDEYPQERIDTIAGSIFANLIAMSIIIATAATIGGTGPLESAGEAAKALEPVAGASAETLFALGLLGASLLAAAVVPLSTAYGVAEAVGAERSVSRRFREAPLFLGLFTAQVVIGAGDRADPGQPHRPADHHAGAQRDHHADHPHVHPDPGEPAVGARRRGEHAAVQVRRDRSASSSSRCSPRSSSSSPSSAGSASRRSGFGVSSDPAAQ